MAAAKNLTPAQLRARASKAAHASHSIDSLVRRIVDRAPELTPEQAAKLRTLFTEPALDVREVRAA